MQQNCEVLVLGVREPHQVARQRSGGSVAKACPEESWEQGVRACAVLARRLPCTVSSGDGWSF